MSERTSRNCRLALLVMTALLLLGVRGSAQSTPPAWAPNTTYAIGAQVTYQSAVYRCIQAHKSQVGWEPTNVPALWSRVSSTTPPDTQAPSAPSGLRVTATTSSSVSLAWNASSDNVGVTGYNIFRGTTAAGTTTANTFNVTGLAASTTYSFTVRATDAAGNVSAASAAVSATTQTGSTPPPGGSCAPAWDAGAVYTAGMTASTGGVNYKANFWTQNQNPATNSGPAGSGQPWTTTGSCTPPTPTPTPIPTPTPTPPPPGSRLFAPYIDMSLTVDQQILTIQQQSGIRVFTLGFIVSSGGGCSPGWGGLGGSLPTDNTANGTSMLTLINGVRSAGGDVIISFGGAVGQELAQTCTTAASLQAAYQTVINRYNVRMLDFDIEGGAATDSASITRRNQALKGLRAANPGLIISYTLPVLPTGLVSSGLNILNSVKAEGLQVNVVNVMAMDYGPANDNGGRMGQNAIDAAVNTRNQIQAVGLTGTTVGVTPMIGINDVNTEVFQLSDATLLVNFALANNFITRLSFWSVARDNGDCPNQGFASPVCSGITQSRYQFASTFQRFR